MGRPSTAFAQRAGLRGLALALALSGGCDGLRRASLKTVDPTIQKNPRWERERAREGFRLGPYTVERAKLREHAADPGLVTPTATGRKPGWRYELELTVRGPERAYVARCTGHRMPTIVADYGEVADVANDEVHVECDVQGEQRWHLRAQGRLDKNIGGELRPPEGSAMAPLKLEIMLWIVRLKLIRRHLAAPIAQLRRDRTAVAAMIIERPQWAWVAAGESAELRGVALTTLLAIDALPLGFDE